MFACPSCILVRMMSVFRKCLAPGSVVALPLLSSPQLACVAAMPKRTMKEVSAHRAIAAKKGKARSLAKPVLKKPCAAAAAVMYTRHGHSIEKSRRDRFTWKRTLRDILLARDNSIVDMLIEDGLLQNMEGFTCAKCGVGKLGPLRRRETPRLWVHRCGKRGCQNRVVPHSRHPIFEVSIARKSIPLTEQATILYALLSGCTHASIRLMFQKNHKVTERIQKRLDDFLMQVVRRNEPMIQYGKGDAWKDVEADEVDLRKLKVEVGSGPALVDWEQWGGIVERGNPSTLTLTRLQPKRTQLRAPGPGPMRTRDWKPQANALLKGRNVILHTDGARAYKMQIPGVLHDHVVHKKKCMCIDGQWVWVKPHFTKVVHHTLPSGEKLAVKAGTQVIDRFWRHLRAFLVGRSSKVGSVSLERRIRAAQWAFWHRDQDLWLALGTALREDWGEPRV